MAWTSLRWATVTSSALIGFSLFSACGSDDSSGTSSGGGGGADASAGAAGTAGTGGATSSGGSAGAGGSEPDASASCGDGVVDASEECDTAIAAGQPGACPTSCDPSTTCMTATVAGTGCMARCVEVPITVSLDGDGCCPSVANANTDDDCSPECGNGTVETGEGCDTGIASGAGACDTAATCSDGIACTVDSVSGAGTCSAACDFSQSAAADLGATDGCCPQGADYTTDADCNPLCGNGTLDANETCDTAIAQGTAGACITSCPDADGNPCTREPLNLDDPCNPTCGSVAITSAINGDGCCPAGGVANSRNDDDCVPTAYRITTLTLMEPHLIGGATCNDGTDTINATLIAPKFSGDESGLPDGGPDGYYDLSFVGLVDPLSQSDPSTFRLYTDAQCTVPTGDGGLGSSVCGPGAGAPQSTLYDNMSTGTCLAPVPGTTHPWTPGIQSSTAGADGCFVTRTSDLMVTILGLTFPFNRAQIAGQWVGDPATGVAEGLIKGFLPKSVGDNLLVNYNGAQIPFGALVVGGSYNDCSDTSLSDLDTVTIGDGGTEDGWWFYLNYEAVQVAWTG